MDLRGQENKLQPLIFAMETAALNSEPNARDYRVGGFARPALRACWDESPLLPGGRDTVTAASHDFHSASEQFAYTVSVPNDMPDLRHIRSVGGNHVDRDHAPD